MAVTTRKNVKVSGTTSTPETMFMVPGANNMDTTIELSWDEFRDPPITNQKYVLLSLVGPTCPQKASIYGVAVRGVASNQEQVELLRNKVYTANPHLDIYQAEVGTLIPLSFTDDAVEDTVHAEEKLDTLMSELKSNFERGLAEFKKHRELIKAGKRDPADLRMMLESVEKQKAELAEQQAFLETELAKAEKEAENFDHNKLESHPSSSSQE